MRRSARLDPCDNGRQSCVTLLPDETLRIRTRDGIELSARRIRSARPNRGPVILQHGLAANGLVFDLPGRSLARFLAQAGHDVFITRLRGADPAAHSGESYGLDAYLDYDLPAIIEHVRAASGCERVAYVGHSMGGFLLIMHVLDQPDAPISRFVAVGSALDYRVGDSALAEQRALLPFAKRLLTRLPFRMLARANALCAGYGPLLPIERLNFMRENIEPYFMRLLLTEGMTDIPVQLLADLDTTFEEGGFVRRQGALRYLTRTAAFKIPSLLLSGTGDTQCGEAAVDDLARLLSSAQPLRVLKLGRAHGQQADYGHFDLIAGRRANVEVWPILGQFLAPE